MEVGLSDLRSGVTCARLGAVSWRRLAWLVALGCGVLGGTGVVAPGSAAADAPSASPPKKEPAPAPEQPREEPSGAAGSKEAAESKDEAWCQKDLETLEHHVCAFVPKDDASDTLVIFLHGVVKSESGWQYNQQLALVRAAKVNHFDLLAPRGRRGIGPKDMEDWWTWPTRSSAQKTLEPELFDEWREARKALEERRGKPYDKLIIVGFSNGAYYASSLVLRDAFEADGYGVFAGGGANYLEATAKRIKHRPPVYVGWGLKDKSAKKDAAGFAKLLKRLGWKHRAKARPKVGHTMTDAGLKEAMSFLRGAK